MHAIRQQQVHLSGQINFNCTGWTTSAPGRIERHSACSAAAPIRHLPFGVREQATVIDIQPNCIAKWSTLCRQLSALPC